MQINKQEIAIALLSKTDRWLKGAMGYLNALLYSSAMYYGAVKRQEDGKLFLVPDGVRRIASGKFDVKMPLTFLKEYLQKFWEGAVSSLPMLRDIRRWLEELGLFQVQEQQFLGSVPQEERTGYMRATYLGVDLRSTLRLYEFLEKIFLERGNSFDDLPPHKGAFVKMLYDEVFTDSVGMSRVNPGGEGYPLTIEEAALFRAQMIRQTTLGGMIEKDSLLDSIQNFRKIGLDKKEVGLFAWMKERLQQVQQMLDRRLADLPY